MLYSIHSARVETLSFCDGVSYSLGVVLFYGIWQADFSPIHPERVAFHDAVVVLQRKEVRFTVENLRRLLEHLRLGDPERGLCDGHGEVVDLNTVELRDGDLDGAPKVKFALPLLERGDDFVFEAAQTDVRFREEVAGATSGIKECERGHFVLEGEKFLAEDRRQRTDDRGLSNCPLS